MTKSTGVGRGTHGKQVGPHKGARTNLVKQVRINVPVALHERLQEFCKTNGYYGHQKIVWITALENWLDLGKASRDKQLKKTEDRLVSEQLAEVRELQFNITRPRRKYRLRQ